MVGAGNTPEVIDRLAAFVSAGADHLVLVPCGGARQATARRLMAEVRPALQDRA
jgi:hypothetical protein